MKLKELRREIDIMGNVDRLFEKEVDMEKRCKKVSLLGIGILLWAINLSAQGPDTLWTRTYGGDTADIGYSVQQTSDGGYIIAGCTYSFGAGKCDVYLIKTDAKGDTLWTKTYGGIWNDAGYSVQETSDGGYIIVGETESFGAGSRDVYLIKTGTKGNTLWTKTYGGAKFDVGRSVQETSDGGYIIAGWTTSFGVGASNVYLIKTDKNGDTLWTRIYGGRGEDMGYSAQQTSDGGYIVTGLTWSSSIGSQDVYLIKTDAKGDIIWTKTYGGTNRDKGGSVQQTIDEGYIIAGYTTSFGAGGYDVYLIKTRPPLKLTSPNGGEVLVSNTIHHITWYPEGTYYDSYRLLYSLDGGETYPYIIANRISPNSGLYSWKVPEIDCNTCRVKVQIRDMKGYVIEEDESDGNFTIQSTGIEEKEALPKTFFVSSIESPQTDRALIKYELPKNNNVHIVIYNLLGQEIKALVSKKQNAGIHTIIWDGRDNSGERLPSGIYFLRFEAVPIRDRRSYGAGGYKATRKLLITR